ncbi:MAG: RCC1 domain-containing protein [Sphaerochaetaceae bacterium]
MTKKRSSVIWIVMGVSFVLFSLVMVSCTCETPAPIDNTVGVAAIYTGDAHTFVLKQDGTLFATGHNNLGQLATGDTTNLNQLTLITVLNNVSTVSCGAGYTMILQNDGTLYGVGENTAGQLGVGNTVDQLWLRYVTDNVASVAAGFDHTLILKTDGSLWATGDNSEGQFGNGTTTNSSSFIQIADIPGPLSAVFTGYKYSMILKEDGTLFATGLNADGQLGIHSTTDEVSFVPVIANVASVSLAKYPGLLPPINGIFSMIVKTDGSLWATGDNDRGQFGDGSQTTTNMFVPVIEDEDVTYVSTGAQSSMIIKADGTLWSVGFNNRGQTGQADYDPITDDHNFVQIMDNVEQVSAGNDFTVILKKDGTLWATGHNNRGQLGSGDTTNSAVPIEITIPSST